MRTLLLMSLPGCLLLVAMEGLFGSDARKEKETKKDPATLLVEQLGSDSFVEREAAEKKLRELGEKALPAVIESAARSNDLEVRRRSQRLIILLLPNSVKSKTLGCALVSIVAGKFDMGSPNTEPGRQADEPQHQVHITRPFFLGSHEVTQDEFEKVMKHNPSWFSGKGPGKDKVQGLATGRFPVERVTWFDAIEFCNRLGQLDGLKPYYQMTGVKREGNSIVAANVKVLGGRGYRLPTEAEWEYACRAGSDTPYHFGHSPSGREANLKAHMVASGYGSVLAWRELGRPTTVGAYSANRWGLYDMHGNVAEWCQDWYDKDYYGKSPASDPPGPATGTQRVQRGGSWLVPGNSSRSASRVGHAPADPKYYTGFRIARNP